MLYKTWVSEAIAPSIHNPDAKSMSGQVHTPRVLTLGKEP
jgi:hypothetical protein